MSAQNFRTRNVGEVLVDSGSIELGDCGSVQLTLSTERGDGAYAVTALEVNGELRGYFISVDGTELQALINDRPS